MAKLAEPLPIISDEAGTSRSPQMKNVVLFGATGSGKSTVANALVTGGLGPAKFESSDRASGCTKLPKTETGRGWRLTDTVGLGEQPDENVEPTLALHEIKDEENKTKKYLKAVQRENGGEGFSYIIYVQKGDSRWKEMDWLIWKIFKEIFEGGEDAFVVLFTGVGEAFLEENDHLILDEMKKYPLCTVNLPPFDELPYLERRYVKTRTSSLQKLEEKLEDLFRKVAFPDILILDDEQMDKKSVRLLRKILEWIKEKFSKESRDKVLNQLYNLAGGNLATIVEVAAAVGSLAGSLNSLIN